MAIANASNSVTAFLTVGNGPSAVAATPDGSQVYVTSNTAGTVSVIDT